MVYAVISLLLSSRVPVDGLFPNSRTARVDIRTISTRCLQYLAVFRSDVDPSSFDIWPMRHYALLFVISFIPTNKKSDGYHGLNVSIMN